MEVVAYLFTECTWLFEVPGRNIPERKREMSSIRDCQQEISVLSRAAGSLLWTFKSFRPAYQHRIRCVAILFSGFRFLGDNNAQLLGYLEKSTAGSADALRSGLQFPDSDLASPENNKIDWAL